MEIEKANLYVACRSLEAMWCAVTRVLESRHSDSRQNICLLTGLPVDGLHTFFSESLILAQNERWRRG